MGCQAPTPAVTLQRRKVCGQADGVRSTLRSTAAETRHFPPRESESPQTDTHTPTSLVTGAVQVPPHLGPAQKLGGSGSWSQPDLWGGKVNAEHSPPITHPGWKGVPAPSLPPEGPISTPVGFQEAPYLMVGHCPGATEELAFLKALWSSDSAEASR